MSLLPTFRDPGGYCLTLQSRVFRIIYPESGGWVGSLLKSSFIQRLIADGLFPRTRRLPPGEAAGLSNEIGPELGPILAQDGFVLEHERIEFPSYPHEWPPDMLYAAGELTLNIQLQALDAGLTLKDATPTNILFRGAQPVFVDLLSFQPRPPGVAVWIAYAQFVRTFLLPLLLFHKQHITTHDLFLGHRDGLEPEDVHAQLSVLARLSPTALQYVSIPTWLGRTKKAETAGPATVPRYDEDRAPIIAAMLVRGLQRVFRKLRPPASRHSTWSDYMTTSTYQSESFQTKEDFVRTALLELAPGTVLDVGCNTGHFSCLAASNGASTVSLDYDPAVIGTLWKRAFDEKLPILPLVMNLARPSPGLGWRNAEQTSFLGRAEGRFDVALLLAVVHHMSVTEGIPLSAIFELMAEIVRRGIIVEFVPPEDPMFRKIIRNKEHLVPRLQRANFEAAFAPWFEQTRSTPLCGSGRIMYLLKKRATITT